MDQGDNLKLSIEDAAMRFLGDDQKMKVGTTINNGETGDQVAPKKQKKGKNGENCKTIELKPAVPNVSKKQKKVGNNGKNGKNGKANKSKPEDQNASKKPKNVATGSENSETVELKPVGNATKNQNNFVPSIFQKLKEAKSLRKMLSEKRDVLNVQLAEKCEKYELEIEEKSQTEKSLTELNEDLKLKVVNLQNEIHECDYYLEHSIGDKKYFNYREECRRIRNSTNAFHYRYYNKGTKRANNELEFFTMVFEDKTNAVYTLRERIKVYGDLLEQYRQRKLPEEDDNSKFDALRVKCLNMERPKQALIDMRIRNDKYDRKLELLKLKLDKEANPQNFVDTSESSMNTDLTGPFPLPETPINDEHTNQLEYQKAQDDICMRAARHLESSIRNVKTEMEFIKHNTTICKENLKKAEAENNCLKKQLVLFMEFYPVVDEDSEHSELSEYSENLEQSEGSSETKEDLEPETKEDLEPEQKEANTTSAVKTNGASLENFLQDCVENIEQSTSESSNSAEAVSSSSATENVVEQTDETSPKEVLMKAMMKLILRLLSPEQNSSPGVEQTGGNSSKQEDGCSSASKEAENPAVLSIGENASPNDHVYPWIEQYAGYFSPQGELDHKAAFGHNVSSSSETSVKEDEEQIADEKIEWVFDPEEVEKEKIRKIKKAQKAEDAENNIVRFGSEDLSTVSSKGEIAKIPKILPVDPWTDISQKMKKTDRVPKDYWKPKQPRQSKYLMMY